MPCARDILFFSRSMLCPGFFASASAASAAASFLPLPLKLRFLGENLGRLPLASISLAAERALLALAAKVTPH